MNKLLMLCCSLLLTGILYSSQINKYITYSDPLPDSKYINRETNILIQPSDMVNPESLLKEGAISVSGSISGIKQVTIKRTENNLIIIKPAQPFALGETVTIRFTNAVNTQNRKPITPFGYSFKIKSINIEPERLQGLIGEISRDKINKLLHHQINQSAQGGPPVITITNDNNPSAGDLFFSNIVFDPNIQNIPYLVICQNDGVPYFERQLDAPGWDFDKQPSGMLTYFDQNKLEYFGLNSTYNIVDSFNTGNGYRADLHELRVLANDNAYILSYDPEYVDMSQIVPGGDPNAIVVGLIIQEIDQNKNVIFQWRSWDHFNILDATHEDFQSYYIDYVHGNALEIENDGNIILSCRHMDEITKINRTNGNIIWRMGGKNNQFTFINDPEGFSHQHAIRRISSTDLTLFDNGNFHTPPHSRACEYNVDEVNKTATLVWQYRNTPDYFGYAMGYVQRLSDGNTLISWGATNPSITEVTSSGIKVFEMTLDSSVFSYRAFRYLWGDTVTGITSNSGIPKNFSLSQNYPNPFNPNTKIKFDIGKTGAVKIIISDVIGREVATLVNKELKAGSYEVNWDASNYPSGVYFYRIAVHSDKLESGSFVQTRKMILIK